MLIRWSVRVIACIMSFAVVGFHMLELNPSREVTYRYVNESYRVTCRARENKNLTWKKPNGDTITEKIGRIRVTKSPVGLQLILEYIREDTGGQYKCFSEDEGQEGSFLLKVAEPVVFTSPTLFEAMLNEDIFLECKVNQKSLPHRQWEFNGNILPTDDRFEFRDEGMFIHNVQLENAGQYYCIVAHSPFQSNENRRKITLIVYTKPLLVGGAKSENVVYSFTNEVTALQCNVTAVPSAYFIWYDENKTALNPKNDNVTITYGDNTSALGITVSQEKKVLICEACNQLGCLNQTIILRNTTKLKQPNIYKWESSSDSVDFFISFQPEATYYLFQYYFDVYDRQWEKPNYHNISIRGREKLEGYIKFNVSNLFSDTKYEVRVAAGNPFVLSEYSLGRKFKTKFGKPPVKVVCSSSNRLRFNLILLIIFIKFLW